MICILYNQTCHLCFGKEKPENKITYSIIIFQPRYNAMTKDYCHQFSHRVMPSLDVQLAIKQSTYLDQQSERSSRVLSKHSHQPRIRPPVMIFRVPMTGLVYLGFNASATARVMSRRWNDDDEICFLVEETGAPGRNHRPMFPCLAMLVTQCQVIYFRVRATYLTALDSRNTV